MSENLIICIGRQFGSGGHDIGEKLAQRLGIPCYDKEILKEAAKESGIVEEFFEKADEKPTNSFLYTLSVGATGASTGFASYNDYFTNDKLFLVQSKIIKEMADKGSCVIIGRCADYILRGYKNRVSVFVHAPLEFRIQRVAHDKNLEEDAARSLIKKTDKNRGNFYNFYADSDWGAASSYDICLNTGKLGIDRCVDMLYGAAQEMK